MTNVVKTNHKCIYFKLHELLPPELYADENTGWDLISDELKITIDCIRGILGVPLIVNNWFWKGARVASGVRPRTGGVGVKNSRHRIPNADAADMISTKMTTPEMWKILEANVHKLPYPIRIERTYVSNGKRIPCTWLHVDTHNTSKQKIYYFNA